MRIYPIIMCGGSGTRLWPESTPERPKQFLPLVGDGSLFQQTAARMAPLAEGGDLLIITGERHVAEAKRQLAEIEVSATLLVEPEARDSCAAVAAAAAWLARSGFEGAAAIVASDHHVADDEAFRSAVREASIASFEQKAIVTLGVRPSHPSAAYGYIRPDGQGLSRVREFKEKPASEIAEKYIGSGYLWNSGNFIAPPEVLLEEIGAHAPDILAVVSQAIDEAEPSTQKIARLSSTFRRARRQSIDYAVMEKTRRAMVLAVDFAWSDLGSWDAVGEAGGGRRGLVATEDVERCVIRAAPGMVVGALGVSDLAIIAEGDSVLVCSLGRSQEVKRLVDRIGTLAPAEAPTASSLGQQAAATARWLATSALPLWATLGVNSDGSFREAIDHQGRAADGPRRARVQTRQAWSFMRAGSHGWMGPWADLALNGIRRFDQDFQRPDGAYRTVSGAGGLAVDDTAMIYDHAFALLAASELHRTDLDRPLAARITDRVLRFLETRRHPAGGWLEAGSHPFQANAHMHLLEAALAWEAAGDARFTPIANEIAGLALTRFFDPEIGRLREFYSEDWTPASGAEGELIEPGHQFEWAWLLARFGKDRSSRDALEAAERLYASGMQGVDPARNVALDELDSEGRVRSLRARLWPQTERLKAALLLADMADEDGRAQRLLDAAAALDGLWLYLDPAGMWRDKFGSDRTFVDEPAPASSLYHIMAGYDQLVESRPAKLASRGDWLLG